MCVWKKSAIILVGGIFAVAVAQAEEVTRPATKAQSKHMVDMADQINTQEFYDSNNPDALWSSELKMPWAKADAINAYEESDSAANKTESAAKEENPGASSSASAAAQVSAGEVTGKVNGKTVSAEQLVNIRVLYTLSPENSRASFSPVSAQNELFRQMSKTCSNGFQKIAEWSEPAGADDYYLYYQFKCMAKR